MNERVILIISHLHLTCRDATKKKYTQLVPQNGITPPPVLQEYHLEMLSCFPLMTMLGKVATQTIMSVGDFITTGPTVIVW
jgi:hypothetical protein